MKTEKEETAEQDITRQHTIRKERIGAAILIAIAAVGLGPLYMFQLPKWMNIMVVAIIALLALVGLGMMFPSKRCPKCGSSYLSDETRTELSGGGKMYYGIRNEKTEEVPTGRTVCNRCHLVF